MENLTGKQFGSYQIVAPLGEGGMAAVYKAYQPAMERYVALKVLPRHIADNPEFVVRFEREAKLLAQLQHPHILPVFDSGRSEGYAYIVMPFLHNGTLTDLLVGKPLPLIQIRKVITQLGEALDYAHTRGLIHRDVKPSNVLMDESGNCLLTDFGLARMVESPINLTTSGAIMGTPAYMSPEQGSGQTIDGRSDVYSLGVILYEMATGRLPYKGETPMAVIFKHIQDPLPPPVELNPSLPEMVELVILKALAKRPQDRYQTAGEMVHALQVAIQESAITQTATPKVYVPPPSIYKTLAPTLMPDADETLLHATPNQKLNEASGVSTAVRPKVPAAAWALVAIGVVVLVGLVAVGGFMLLRPGFASNSAPTAASLQTATSPILHLALFDDQFDNRRYDGSIDTTKWKVIGKNPTDTASHIQSNGVLTSTMHAVENRDLEIHAIPEWKFDEINYAEWELKVDKEVRGDFAGLSVGLVTQNDDRLVCDFKMQVSDTALRCVLWNPKTNSYFTEIPLGNIPLELARWYTFRVEVMPTPAGFRFFLDNQPLGEFAIKGTAPWKGKLVHIFANIGGTDTLDTTSGQIDYAIVMGR